MFCVSHRWTGRPSSAPLPLLARWALKQETDSATLPELVVVCVLMSCLPVDPDPPSRLESRRPPAKHRQITGKSERVDAPWWLDTVQLSALSLIKSLINPRRSEPAAQTHLSSSSSRLPSGPEKTHISLSEKSRHVRECE